MKELTCSFFDRDAVKVAQDLLGKVLTFKGCSGVIVETEAYKDDEASHAAKKTARSEPIRNKFGTTYVYLNYGMYHLVNFTADSKRPGAVLIRAVEPLEGIHIMQKRRNKEKVSELCSGPGKLCQAFGITMAQHNKKIGEDIKVFDAGNRPKIVKTSRVGISKAKELLWRFYIKDNEFVSKK